MMTRLLRIADVQCKRLRFEPGDRVIVRVHQRLDRDARCKLRRAVERWAGTDVEVLVVDLTRYDIEVEKGVRTG